MTEATDTLDLRALADRSGLELPDQYLRELATMWVHVEPMVARLRRGRPYRDEPAQVFDMTAIAQLPKTSDHG